MAPFGFGTGQGRDGSRPYELGPACRQWVRHLVTCLAPCTEWLRKRRERHESQATLRSIIEGPPRRRLPGYGRAPDNHLRDCLGLVSQVTSASNQDAVAKPSATADPKVGPRSSQSREALRPHQRSHIDLRRHSPAWRNAVSLTADRSRTEPSRPELRRVSLAALRDARARLAANWPRTSRPGRQRWMRLKRHLAAALEGPPRSRPCR
jgi:hypothetical protein